MTNQSYIIVLIIGVLLLLSSCAHDHSHEEGGHNHDTETNGHTEDDGHSHHDLVSSPQHEDGKIHLTKEQIKTVNIEFGDFSNIKINDCIKATGTLGLPPNAFSSVSAKANGFIKNSNKYVEGNYVKKGVIMAYLENYEFIDQQQAYLEVNAELTFVRQELERQKTLMDANAGVLKKVQQLQSDVNKKTATLRGLEKKMTYLGINVSELTTENIVERIAIISPMSGYITSIKMHNGMYVEPNMELMEIVNENHLHLELDVFEKDIVNVKENQKITYTVPALGHTIYEGEVHVTGKEFNTENKTVRIHGHLEKERPQFIKDLFIEAKIWLNDQTLPALPEKAIIKDGASSYIYVANDQSSETELTFESIMVVPGTTEKGFTAVKLIDKIPDGMKIVTKGAYYVYAQSKAGELEHSH